MNISNKNIEFRYPGVTPFTATQNDIFFGRDKAQEELLRLIRQEKISVLYSKSGLGKSSLVNAGLTPYCLREKIYCPILIRFGTDQKEDHVPPLVRIKDALGNKSNNRNALDFLLPEEHSLWKQVKNLQFQGTAPVLFIFDQFEELFTYEHNLIREFQLELSELINKKIPLRFRRALDTIKTEDHFEDKLEEELDCRILFVIRSDRLHMLNRISDFFPEVLKSVFELTALSKEEAKEAIQKPASLAGLYKSPPFSYSPKALGQLIDFLQNDSNELIEGILLQMLCEHFERNLIVKQGLEEIESADLNDLRKVVANYYEEKINELPTSHVDKARRLIEEGLLSDHNSIRLSLHEAIIEREFGVKKEMLDLLVDSRLLRAEPFARGGLAFELAHDRLIPAVLKSRDKRRENAREQKQLEKEKERKKEQEQMLTRLEKDRQAKEKAQKQLRLVRSLLISVVTALIIAIYGIYYALDQRKLAEKRQKETENAKIEIEKNYQKLKITQTTRDSLEFDILYARAKSVVEGGFIPPQDWLYRLAEIARGSEDSIQLQLQLQWLQENILKYEN